MSEKSLVSVIVPVYNVENKINRSMDSLLNQTYDNIEIILVNDGSTDNSSKLCDDFATIDKRVKVIHKPNGGVSSARNRGLKEASGEYIMFADSDDYMEKTTCEVMVNAIEKYNVDFIVSSYNTVYNGKIMRHLCNEKVYNNLSDISEDFPVLFIDCFFNSPWNKLFKKEFITVEFNENMQYFEDYYFVLDYMDNIKTLATIDTPLYYYVEDVGNSLTKVFRDNIFDVFPVIYKRQTEFCHKYLGDKFDEYLKVSLLYGLYNSIQKLVYSNNTKKYKLNKIKEWINNEVITSDISKNILVHIDKRCELQQRIVYRFIISHNYKTLYYWLKGKKITNPLLQIIKNIIKGRKKEYKVKDI